MAAAQRTCRRRSPACPGLPDSTVTTYRWSLARRSGPHSKVRLEPGKTAHFDVSHLPTASGNIDNMTVVKMMITPPGAHARAELSWSPFVLLPDKAAHPGT